MFKSQSYGVIHVKDINLWAHVGVLDHERLYGQPFLLDIKIWLNVDRAAADDDLALTADYSLAIYEIQQLAFQLSSQTIENFSEHILDCLETFYGRVPIYVFLRKVSPPIPGFDGTVGLERTRYKPPE